MKILHTSDWHLGRSLCGQSRYDEFESFLTWLADTIVLHQVDVLLVAGDVFDTISPSNRAQALYYRFLCRAAASSCRHIVITAGNHDSGSFLNAPRDVLQALNVHVVGSVTENRVDEVLVLTSEDGRPELIVCAVPYLRDRDIRVAVAGESVADKEKNLIEGISDHYAEVVALAEEKRRTLDADLPVVAMGHLFTAGGQTVDGDGVRDLYVGSLVRVSGNAFPAGIDYFALGHLHTPQKVKGSETMRYSGSPLPMGFGEAKQEKSLCLVTLAGGSVEVDRVRVPIFQHLDRVRGSWEEIAAAISELARSRSRTWLEVVYEGDAVIPDLRQRLEEAVAGVDIKILRVSNHRIIDRVLDRSRQMETLDDLSVNDVFERCLTLHDVPGEQRPELFRAYLEAVAALHDEADQPGVTRG